MLFACWRCSKFLAGNLCNHGSQRVNAVVCGTNPCLRPFVATNRESSHAKNLVHSVSIPDVSVHTRCVWVSNSMALVLFFWGVSDFRVSFSHPTDGFPQQRQSHESTQEAIITRGLQIGFHVRLRHHLPRRARATHPKHSSEHRSLETPWGSPQQMRASHRTQQASAVRGTSRGHFATGRAHIKEFAVGRLSFARTDRRDPRLCLDSTIAHVDAKVWIEEKSFNPCVEDIASAKVVSHSSEGVGLTIDVTKAHKRFSFSFESDNSAAIGNMHLLWSAPPGMSYQLAQSGVGTTSKMDWARHQFLLVFLANHERKKGQSP